MQTVEAAEQSVWEPLPSAEESTEDTQPAQVEQATQTTLPDLQQLPGELAETIRETGEEVINEAVEEAKAEVQAKAKEVKRNFLVRLWEHIKKMFHDFFASIFS